MFTKTLTQDYLIDTLKAQDTGTSTTVPDRGHSFGDDINLTGITDNVTPARSETYAYTPPANRLQTAGGIWGSVAYGYDSVGNRTSETLTSGGTTTWTYASPPTNNKLSTVTKGANVRTLTHDGAGNISADDRVGTVYNYRYNNRGRLDRLTIGSTVTADYVYDGLERLAIRTTQNMSPARTTHYVYDLGGRLIAEADDTGQTLREYVWLDEMPLAVVADVDTTLPQLWFVHADHLDRPVRMTDGAQAVVWDAVYRPFGQTVSITGSASNNLRFPGQYFLIESGLHYNWHRHYDPTTGRYLQPDPIQLTMASQTNLNGNAPSISPISSFDVLNLGLKEMPISVRPNTLRTSAAVRSLDFITFTGSMFGEASDLYGYAKQSPLIRVDRTRLFVGPTYPNPPTSTAQQCMGGKNCAAIIAACKQKCVDSLFVNPGGPGGFENLRRCVRQCAAAQGCFGY